MHPLRKPLGVLILSAIALIPSLSAQNFTGKITYTIEAVDTAVRKFVPTQTMTLYTNDTLSRLEVNSPVFGQQITIRHLTLHKSYLLVEFDGKKYAIQTDDTAKEGDTTRPLDPYTIDYKCFKKKKIGTYKMKRAQVVQKQKEFNQEIYYFTKIRPDLLDVYEGIKGLPAIYYLDSKDGLMKYTAIEISKEFVSKDLFGIPSDYKRIRFDDFLKEIMPEEN